VNITTPCVYVANLPVFVRRNFVPSKSRISKNDISWR